MAKLVPYTQRYTSGARRASASAFDRTSEYEGRAMSKFGDSLIGLGDVLNKASQAAKDAKLANVNAIAKAKLVELRTALSYDNDWGTHGAKYQQGVDEIKAWAKDELGDETEYGLWEPRFQPEAIREGVAVSGNTIKMQINDAKAQTQSMLDTTTILASETNDPNEKRKYIDNGLRQITKNRENGIITPLEELKQKKDFLGNVAGAEVRKEIRVDPKTAYMRLQDASDPINQGLTAEQREIWVDRALKSYEADLRKQDIEERRMERKAEKEQDRLEKQTAKEADVLVANDEMTVEWLYENQDNMKPADFRYHLKQQKDGYNEFINNIKYADLSKRAYNGEDVRQQADQAMIDGELPKSHRDAINNIVEERIGSLKGWTTATRNFIQTTFGSDEILKSIPFGTQRKAEALYAWDQWILENPDATPEQGNKKARDIIAGWQWQPLSTEIFQKERMMYGPDIPTPDMDIGLAKKKTREAFLRGEITEDQFQAETAKARILEETISKMNER